MSGGREMRGSALRGIQEELARMTTLGSNSEDRKRNLEDYALKLREGKRDMRVNHFVSLVKGLRLRREGAEDAFAYIDRGNEGRVDISLIVDSLLNVPRGYPSSPPPNATATSPKGQSSGMMRSPGGRGGGNQKDKMRSSVHLHNQQGQAQEIDLSAMIIEKFRQTVIQRGGSHGIHAIGRIFRIMDDDGNHKLSSGELQSGLADYGLKYDNRAITILMDALDKHGKGVVTFDEFLIQLRGPVSKRRRALIDLAFGVLDRSNTGRVTVDDIASRFDTKHHPDVVSGKLKQDKALSNWLAQFDGPDGDGKITREEFQHYYKNVSASIDDDDYFELMIRNAWHIPGGQGQYENTANTRVLVTFCDGSQKVVMIEDDLGLDLKDQAAVIGKLKKQGVKNVVNVSRSGKV